MGPWLLWCGWEWWGSMQLFIEKCELFAPTKYGLVERALGMRVVKNREIIARFIGVVRHRADDHAYYSIPGRHTVHP